MYLLAVEAAGLPALGDSSTTTHPTASRALQPSASLVRPASLQPDPGKSSEGQIFGPMSRTYAYALIGAVIATFTVTPVMASILLPAHVQEVETILVRSIRKLYQFVLPRAVRHYRIAATIALAFLLVCGILGARLRRNRRAFAVLRLMTISILVENSDRQIAGLRAAFKILSTARLVIPQG
jgi:hypothetical protein